MPTWLAIYLIIGEVVFLLFEDISPDPEGDSPFWIDLLAATWTVAAWPLSVAEFVMNGWKK